MGDAWVPGLEGRLVLMIPAERVRSRGRQPRFIGEGLFGGEPWRIWHDEPGMAYVVEYRGELWRLELDHETALRPIFEAIDRQRDG